MRRVAVLLLLVSLVGCIPPGRQVSTGRARGRPSPAELSTPQLRQCLADLGSAGARYSPLPDRMLGGGCSQIGTVRLTDVGVPVTGLGPMKCRLAERFTAWAQDAVQKSATAWLGSPVVRIESFGTYACRPVNNREGARLSEHGRADAVDVAAFLLADGRRITVRDGWNGGDPQVRDFLRAIHKAACRRFSIVIGPDGDAMHYNHFHFDLGGNGPYCH